MPHSLALHNQWPTLSDYRWPTPPDYGWPTSGDYEWPTSDDYGWYTSGDDGWYTSLTTGGLHRAATHGPLYPGESHMASLVSLKLLSLVGIAGGRQAPIVLSTCLPRVVYLEESAVNSIHLVGVCVVSTFAAKQTTMRVEALESRRLAKLPATACWAPWIHRTTVIPS